MEPSQPGARGGARQSGECLDREEARRADHGAQTLGTVDIPPGGLTAGGDELHPQGVERASGSEATGTRAHRNLITVPRRVSGPRRVGAEVARESASEQAHDLVELEQQRMAAEVLAHPWPEDSRLEPPADPLRPLLWLQQLEEPQLGSEVREVWERGTACEGGRARGWDSLGGRVLERMFGGGHS